MAEPGKELMVAVAARSHAEAAAAAVVRPWWIKLDILLLLGWLLDQISGWELLERIANALQLYQFLEADCPRCLTMAGQSLLVLAGIGILVLRAVWVVRRARSIDRIGTLQQALGNGWFPALCILLLALRSAPTYAPVAPTLIAVTIVPTPRPEPTKPSFDAFKRPETLWNITRSIWQSAHDANIECNARIFFNDRQHYPANVSQALLNAMETAKGWSSKRTVPPDRLTNKGVVIVAQNSGDANRCAEWFAASVNTALNVNIIPIPVTNKPLALNECPDPCIEIDVGEDPQA